MKPPYKSLNNRIWGASALVNTSIFESIERRKEGGIDEIGRIIRSNGESW